MDISFVIEALGFCVGLLYLWWEYQADSRLWLVSMVMPFISMWIYFNKGLYADFGINIYYLLIAVYGYVVWTRKKSGDTSAEAADGETSLPVSHIPAGTAVMCSVAALLLWLALYLGLNYLTDSTVPVADAFTTALSIVGMWLLARKYIEQWLVWIAVDAVCVGLYCYKGIYLYALLYLIYTVIACFGYRKWYGIMMAGHGMEGR